MKKVFFTGAALVIAVLIGLFLIMQIIPYGRAHTNPPVGQEPAWDSPQTRALAKRACFDCHSNETFWPAYSNIAPVSWLVQRDVDEGREKLNFSNWGQGEEQDEIVETVQKGEMPPAIYLVMHPEAKLSKTEKQALLEGLTNTFGAGGEGGEGPEN